MLPARIGDWKVDVDVDVDVQKTTALACSTASPNRPIGTWFIRLPNFSGVLRKSMSKGVRIGPLPDQLHRSITVTEGTYGQRELNRIPSLA